MPVGAPRRQYARVVLNAVVTLAAAAALVTVAAAQRRPPTPRGTVLTPTVTGPIASVPAGDASRNYPFHASVIDLKARGYVEEEFFVEGAASRYTTPAQATGAVVDAGHPYKTRLVVRRPAARERFNGIVVLEWNNVTAGHDLDIDWFQSYDYFMRNGYAWVGATPQRIGVEALKLWNATRYGSLDVTAGGKIEGDALSFDIYAQIAQAIRAPKGVNVLGGWGAEMLLATGHSQSAGRLATYINSIHPLAPVFDGFMVHGGGGRIRVDAAVPVFKILAETDVLGSQAANRQSQTGMFRSWEVAGTSHVDLQFVTYSRQLRARDASPSASTGRGAAPAAAAAPQASGRGSSAAGLAGQAQTANAGGCDRPSYSHIPFHYVMNAAFDHLVRWVRDEAVPPAAPPIDTDAVQPSVVLARDARGNATGGIQLPHHAVPTGVNTGQNSGPGFCRLNGSHVPFDAATLTALYPTHAAYVAAVKQATAEALQQGYILKVDADAIVAEAEQSTIGKR